MSDDQPPLKAIGEVIPSVYYDLIARVAAGVPFVLLGACEANGIAHQWKDTVGTTGLLLLMLVGSYLVGLLLSSFSGIFDLPVRLFMRKRLGLGQESLEDDSYTVVRWMNDICVEDKEAGATLVKMMAEKTLCQNLLAGFLIVILFFRNELIPTPSFLHSTPVLVLLPAVLVIAVVQRGIAYFYRLKTFHETLESLKQARGHH